MSKGGDPPRPKPTSPLGVVLFTERQAAKALRVSERTLQKWRLNGKGPKYLRMEGRAIRYRRSDLLRFIQESIRGPGATG